jgi:uncharacterized protein YegL
MKDEIIAILDRSGSMSGYENATINGFNSFIEEQRKISEDCAVTLILFDDKYEVIYEACPIAEVPKLNREIYFTRGSTALRDAIGKATEEAGNRFNRAWNKPEKVIVYINTDGYENASVHYSEEKLKGIIRHQEDKYGWEYIYAGCDHKVDMCAAAIGIKLSNTFQYNKDDLLRSYGTSSTMVGNFRSN